MAAHAAVPPLMLVPGEDKDKVIADSKIIVTNWLQRFKKAFAADQPDFSDLFVAEGYLKDSVALSWDSRALEGIEKITSYVVEAKKQRGRRLFNFRLPERPQLHPLLKEMGPRAWIESGISFETDIGSGAGLLRLTNVALGEWRAWILFIGLREVNGHPLHRGSSRHYFHGDVLKLDVPEEVDENTKPAVVIIGAGHCGLSLAACLRDRNVRTLVIDRNERVGDSWRQRYKSLQLHSPNWADNMPYLDFPTTWPIFPDKNQVADWLEFYAKTLDIPVWTRTTFEKGDYSDATGSWTVETVKRDATGHVVKRMTLHPSHVVYSGNGHIFGQPNIPEWAQDSSVFKGVLYHAGEHTDTTRIRDVQNKRIVVVGSNTGSHDICMDYVRAGAKSVTMIQRGTSIVASKETVMTAFPPPRAGMSSEDAIFERTAVPTKVQLTLIAGVQKMSELRDKELLDGLRKTEYALSTGEGGDSILAGALGRRGGFYLNQGGSEAVIDGRIKVMRSPKGIERLTPTGMVLLDGREVEADVIVLATSWKLFENAIGDVMGEDTARRTSGIWGIDAEGELGGFFRPTGHPGFWVTIGNFLGANIRVPELATMIQTVELGLNPKPKIDGTNGAVSVR